MTDLTERTQQRDPVEPEVASDRIRFWKATVAILALALVGLGAWVVSDLTATSDTAISPEVQTVVDAYLSAWNDYDGEAFRELITSDYALHMTSGPISITQNADQTATMFETLEDNEWAETMVSEPIMTGNGPWFVAVAEHFTSEVGYGPEGADGVSTFTVVDDGGTLRIARHTYVGNN